MIAFQKSLALEYAKKNININCVSPGFIKTDMTEKINEGLKKSNKIPSKNSGQEKMFKLCSFFGIRSSKLYNRRNIHVNGGLYMS